MASLLGGGGGHSETDLLAVAMPLGSNFYGQTRPGAGPASLDVAITVDPPVHRLNDGATSAANSIDFQLPVGWDPTVMNIYRAVAETDGTVDVYLNNDPISVATFSPRTPSFGGGHGISLGPSANLSGPIQFDYVRLASGAFVPVIPEPASLAFLSLGGLMLLRRRQ